MDARSNIEEMANSKLKAYCRMMTIDDVSLAEFHPDKKAELDQVKADYDEITYDKRMRDAGYENDALDQALNDRVMLMEDAKRGIYADAAAKNLESVQQDFGAFMQVHGRDIYEASSDKACHASLLLKVMHQVIGDNVRDIDPVRLANAVMHFCDIRQLNHETAQGFVSLIRIMQFFILPALMLADEKAIKTFMKTAEAHCKNGRLDQSLQIAILNSLSQYIDKDSQSGTAAERNISDLAHYERCLKVCKTLHASKTFKQSKKPQPFFAKKEVGRVGKMTEIEKIMQRVEGYIQHFKSEVEEDKKNSSTTPGTKM